MWPVYSTKKSAKGKAPGKAGTRFWKSIGLGFKTPREAIEGMGLIPAAWWLWHSHVERCMREGYHLIFFVLQFISLYGFCNSGFILCTGTYIDKKCPFTGNVSIRGRILTGTVNCAKMTRTITIRRDYLHFVPKYQRSVYVFFLKFLHTVPSINRMT